MATGPPNRLRPVLSQVISHLCRAARIKRRTNVFVIFPNDAAITRLVGSQLLEQQEEWQLERRRFFSEATMAKIPEPEETFELTDPDPSAQPDKLIS